MLDYTDFSAWLPPFIAVVVVCLVLLCIYRMARTVRSRLESIEEQYREQVAKKGSAAKNTTSKQKEDHRTRRDEIERARSTQMMCLRIGIAVVGIPAFLGCLLAVQLPWGPTLAAVVVVAAALGLRGTVSPRVYSRERNAGSAKGSQR